MASIISVKYRTNKVDNDTIIKHFLIDKFTITKIASLYQLDPSSIAYQLRKIALKNKEVYLELDFRHKHRGISCLRKVKDDDKLARLYAKGNGFTAVAKILGISKYSVYSACKRLGILDRSRTTPRHDSNWENYPYKGLNKRHRQGKEFSSKIKQERFEEVKGICEFCGNTVGDGKTWRDAGCRKASGRNLDLCYHHKIACVLPNGTGNKENCMVLHRKCHRENYYILHKDLLKFRNKHDKTFLVEKLD